MVDIRQVKEFLVKVKAPLKQGSFDFIPRRKNMDSIKSSGLTIKHIKEIINKLSYKNYSKGPLMDTGHNRQGYVWEFGYKIEGKEFYIKLKTEERNGYLCLICLSFHEAEFPLKYPLIDYN